MLRFAILMPVLFGILAAADVKDVHRTVALAADGSVTLENHKGSIQVTTWDRREVDIQARIEAEPGSSMDRRRFEGTEVDIGSSPDSVRIRTRYPDFGLCCSWEDGTNPEVRYTVRMPRGARLTIHDHRSTMEISDVGGALEVETHRGTVRVHGLGGPLRLMTHRGDASVDFASFAGDSRIETYRGTIALGFRRGSKFDVRTDLGRHAAFESDFPLTVRSGFKTGNSMRASVNGGGATLAVQSYRGQIRLRTL